jgi:hypothetical protein
LRNWVRLPEITVCHFLYADPVPRSRTLRSGKVVAEDKLAE